ncbi:hypothetical protein [Streptomyces sp. IBSBF 3136]|uniref:hypothetical protein n=1 Tax=Streptomyces sp. IBSBF 3136 TaxID=2903524 RepID=UPI002FDC29B2
MLCVCEAALAPTAGGTGGQPPPAASLVAVVLVAPATVAGATAARVCSARRASGRSVLVPAAASGILLVIAVLDLLPDAWDEARQAGLPPWAVPFTALASFAVTGAVTPLGCPCTRGRAGGIGAASGLAVHRFVEGAALALTSSPAVVTALLVHAAGEGPALTALLGTRPGRRVAPWIAPACLSPVAGVFVAGAAPVPDGLLPFLLAVVAGAPRAGGVGGARPRPHAAATAARPPARRHGPGHGGDDARGRRHRAGPAGRRRPLKARPAPPGGPGGPATATRHGRLHQRGRGPLVVPSL